MTIFVASGRVIQTVRIEGIYLLPTTHKTKRSHPLDIRSEQGSTLVTYLIAFGILMTATVETTRAFFQMKEAQLLAEGSTPLFAKDQMVRHEVGKVLQVLQKRITELDPTTQCKPQTYNELITTVQNRFVMNQGVFFGRFADISTEPNFPGILKTTFADLTAESQAQVGSGQPIDGATTVLNAINRCNSRQTIIKSGMADISNRNSIYICGYAQDFFVEVKGTFWNFNIDRPMNCNAMNEQTGRGIQAVYNAYYFEKVAPRKGKFPYSVRSHKGKLYVAKNVWAND